MTGPDAGDAVDRGLALEEALVEALASVHDRGAAPAPESVDRRWLGIGIRLGLERPGHARHLLDLLMATAADHTDTVEPVTEPGEASSGSGAHVAGPGVDADGDAARREVPATSLFLARSAAFSSAERKALGPDVTYGWATELSAAQVLRIGRVVSDMLADGAPANIGRGFGLAWDGGARLPRHERDALFSEFTELQVEVAGVLVGRNLRTAETGGRQRGFGAVAQLFGNRSGGPSPTTAAIEAAGEPGQRGLVALWNTWAAMRFRAAIPDATFELLTRPWVTVVGPLPD